MDDLLPRLRAWSRARTLLDGSAADLDAVLDRLTAVYSSHPTAPLSLGVRLPSLRPDDVTGLDADRGWLRLPAMRGSIFAIPTELAPRVVAATATPLPKLAGRLKYAGYTWDEYDALKPRILAALAGPATTAQLQAAVPTHGKLMAVVRMMAFEGLVLRLSASLKTDKLTYVATEPWLGRRIELPDQEESLAWLAGRYLDAFGPARVTDFAWWLGMTKTAAKRALATVETVDVGGGLLLPAALRSAFEATAPLTGDEADVLPKWDPMTMAWEGGGRQRFVDDRHKGAILSHMGDGLPLLLRGGRAVATWTRKSKGKRLQIDVTPLDGEQVELAPFEDKLQAVGRLLGAASTTIALAG
jgi:hypothetical protein